MICSRDRSTMTTRKSRKSRCRLLSPVALSTTLLVLGLWGLPPSCWRVRRVGVNAFSPTRRPEGRGPIRRLSSTPTTTPDDVSLEELKETMSAPPCYWKPAWQQHQNGNRQTWLRRIHLEDLRVGQKLEGSVTRELLDGKTGPKIFFEVGVGRTDSKGRWSIVNGMLRLDRAKESVVRKRVARMRRKEPVELWVSRVQSGCGRLEVCLSKEDIQKYQSKPKAPVSSLLPGTEVKGRVVRILPYGVMVDVGANRLGLLHILKVRELYGKYIEQEKGLIEAGLERGANIRLCVKAIDKRRLELDFTDDVKTEANAELEAKRSKSSSSSSLPIASRTSSVEKQNNELSDEEMAEWAALAAAGDGQPTVVAGNLEESLKQGTADDEEEDSDDDYDDYDEQRDIEDSLGLGYY